MAMVIVVNSSGITVSVFFIFFPNPWTFQTQNVYADVVYLKEFYKI
jgi:hypothetical protein